VRSPLFGIFLLRPLLFLARGRTGFIRSAAAEATAGSCAAEVLDLFDDLAESLLDVVHASKD
jgi:hypothetical protein